MSLSIIRKSKAVCRTGKPKKGIHEFLGLLLHKWILYGFILAERRRLVKSHRRRPNKNRPLGPAFYFMNFINLQLEIALRQFLFRQLLVDRSFEGRVWDHSIFKLVVHESPRRSGHSKLLGLGHVGIDFFLIFL